VSYNEHIRKGFSIVNRKPGLIIKRLAFGIVLPLLLFLVLYLPVLSSLREALAAIGSHEGIRLALERPRETASMILWTVLFSYAALVICLLAFLAGGAYSEKTALGVLSDMISRDMGIQRPGGSLREGRGGYRPLMLYSLIFSIVLLALMLAFGLLGAIVAGLVAALVPAEGILMQTMLLITTGATFFLSLVFLYCVRLEGLAFLVLDGLSAPKAFFMALGRLWRNPASANATALMLTGYGLLQPLMVLGAWGLFKVPDIGVELSFIWFALWLVLDIYLGLCIKAAVFVAHGNESQQEPQAPVTMEEVAGILGDASGPPVDTPDVWGYYENMESREGHQDTAI
jgi:hypothetical protein